MTKHKYVSKRLRPLAVEIENFYNRLTNKRKLSYCHLEERWRPTEDFDYYKVGKRKPMIHGVCRECIDHGIHFGSCFKKDGYFRQKIVDLQQNNLLLLI